MLATDILLTLQRRLFGLHLDKSRN